MISDWLRPYTERAAEPHALSARDAAEHLLAQHTAGEPWAQEVLLSHLTDSLTRRIKAARQAGHVTTLIRGKRRARVKTMPSRPHVDQQTGEQLGWSLADLWDLDATGLRAVLAAQTSEQQGVIDRITVTRRLLDALARHPECTTAREAWLAEGRSHDEIDLSA
jgi:hypothetical protein